MAYCTTQGIVLRRSDWRESDRVLTLLTPDRGRVEATARGARKLKSPLLTATELCTLGEYVLYQGKGHEIVSAFTLIDAFYPLRLDAEKLSHAALLLRCCELAAQKEEEARHLFILLSRSLKRLSDGSMEDAAVTAAFLLHFSAVEGFKPRLNHCAVCGKPMGEGESGWLSAASGGILCAACHPGVQDGRYIPPESLGWLRAVLAQGVEKTAPAPAPLNALITYVRYHLDAPLPDILRI